MSAMVSHLIDKYKFDVKGTDNPHGLRDFYGDFRDMGPPLTWAIMEKNLAAVHELLKHGQIRMIQLARSGRPLWALSETSG